jgi:hypothetical protein
VGTAAVVFVFLLSIFFSFFFFSTCGFCLLVVVFR